MFAYDGLAVGETVDEVPELIERVHANKGADGSALRALRNHLVFVAADENAADGMRRRMRSRLALQRLKAPDRLVDLAEHQQVKPRPPGPEPPPGTDPPPPPPPPPPPAGELSAEGVLKDALVQLWEQGEPSG